MRQALPEDRTEAGIPGLTHAFAEVNGVRLHYVEAGEGPLVVLLHGFPELWLAWRRQIPMLADAGLRVVAPDMRGYGLSDKPRGWRNYDREHLGDDVAGLIRHLGVERAHLVGHDWGGIVAFYTAIDHPEVIDRLVVLNGGHPNQFGEGLRHPGQLLRSWYMFYFQLPWLPERTARARGWRLLREPLENDARPGSFSRSDIERYRENWSQPGAITAQINYYRALGRRLPRLVRAKNNPPIKAPTLVVWGERDRYAQPRLAKQDHGGVPNLERVVYLSATHWVQHDEPERVGQEIIGFLGGEAAEGSEG